MEGIELMQVPALYPIVDAGFHEKPLEHAEALLAAGIRFLQLRAKDLSAREVYELATAMRSLTREARAALVINDRPDVAAAVGADGLHLGQDDMPPASAKKLFSGFIGLSTHNIEQVRQAQDEPVEYLGFGPIFPTTGKKNPDPVCGIEGLEEAAAASRHPIVAIGGIREDSFAALRKAGAVSVAVIGALGKTPTEVPERLKRWREVCAI